MNALYRKVLSFIQENNLISSGDRILVACSGGPDSVFLLHFLSTLSEEKKIKLQVAYVHHHLRPEADKELKFVQNLAREKEIPFSCWHLSLERKSSLEAKARLARYSCLAKIAKRKRCHLIATGHNLDDQAETVLMRILRGCGITGLRGIQPYVACLPGCDVPVIRPLLVLTKQEIENFLLQHRLTFLKDSSNLNPDFFRNRIRHQILPYLENFNPHLKKHLARIATLVRDDLEILTSQAQQAKIKLCHSCQKGYFFDRKSFLQLPVAIQRLLISCLCQEIRGTPYQNYYPVENIRLLIQKGKPGKTPVKAGLKLQVAKETIVLGKSK